MKRGVQKAKLERLQGGCMPPSRPFILRFLVLTVAVILSLMIGGCATTGSQMPAGGYSFFFNPGDHLSRLIKERKFVEAEEVYNREIAFFKKNQDKYHKILDHLASELNNIVSPDLKSLGGPPPCRFKSGPRHHEDKGFAGYVRVKTQALFSCVNLSSPHLVPTSLTSVFFSNSQAIWEKEDPEEWTPRSVCPGLEILHVLRRQRHKLPLPLSLTPITREDYPLCRPF